MGNSEIKFFGGKEMNALNWINDWFQSNCNGDWEHGYGITIETLDNPGWSVAIYLYDTELEGQLFKEIKFTNREDDWMVCKVENYFFKGMGDPNKLQQILEIFVAWAKQFQD